MFYSIQSIAEYLRRKSRPASRASSGKSVLTETNPVASVPSEFFVNGHTPHFPGDTCSQDEKILDICRLIRVLNLGAHFGVRYHNTDARWHVCVGGSLPLTDLDAVYASLLNAWEYAGFPNTPQIYVGQADRAKVFRAFMRSVSSGSSQCSQSVIGRFGPAPVGASKSEEQTLGYLLGTKMEYQPHTLSYRLDDRGASQLKELFPETWAMFERGLADGHRIRESARGG